jgi:hypothetical protein
MARSGHCHTLSMSNAILEHFSSISLGTVDCSSSFHLSLTPYLTFHPSSATDCRCVPGIWTLIAVRGIWLCANARYFVETGWVSLSHLQACRSTYKLLKF